jgi:hypothetical protein
MHGLHETYHRLRNCFGCTKHTIGDVGHGKCILVYLEIVLVSVQDSAWFAPNILLS